MFGNKIKGPISLKLEKDQMCTVWEGKAKECVFGLMANSNADYYVLWYRNGEFMGTPKPDGGVFYPFSYDPNTKGTRSQNKEFAFAKIVCISRAFNLEMYWGTPNRFLMFEEGKAYRVGASGKFFVEIDAKDAGRNADRLYRKLFSHGNAAQKNVEAVRDELRAVFLPVIGSVLQEHLIELNRPMSHLLGLSPKEMIEISEDIYAKVKDIFASFGLTISPASKKSIIGNLLICEEGAEQEAAAAAKPRVGYTPMF